MAALSDIFIGAGLAAASEVTSQDFLTPFIQDRQQRAAESRKNSDRRESRGRALDAAISTGAISPDDVSEIGRENILDLDPADFQAVRQDLLSASSQKQSDEARRRQLTTLLESQGQAVSAEATLPDLERMAQMGELDKQEAADTAANIQTALKAADAVRREFNDNRLEFRPDQVAVFKEQIDIARQQLQQSDHLDADQRAVLQGQIETAEASLGSMQRQIVANAVGQMVRSNNRAAAFEAFLSPDPEAERARGQMLQDPDFRNARDRAQQNLDILRSALSGMESEVPTAAVPDQFLDLGIGTTTRLRDMSPSALAQLSEMDPAQIQREIQRTTLEEIVRPRAVAEFEEQMVETLGGVANLLPNISALDSGELFQVSVDPETGDLSMDRAGDALANAARADLDQMSVAELATLKTNRGAAAQIGEFLGMGQADMLDELDSRQATQIVLEGPEAAEAAEASVEDDRYTRLQQRAEEFRAQIEAATQPDESGLREAAEGAVSRTEVSPARRRIRSGFGGPRFEDIPAKVDLTFNAGPAAESIREYVLNESPIGDGVREAAQGLQQLSQSGYFTATETKALLEEANLAKALPKGQEIARRHMDTVVQMLQTAIEDPEALPSMLERFTQQSSVTGLNVIPGNFESAFESADTPEEKLNALRILLRQNAAIIISDLETGTDVNTRTAAVQATRRIIDRSFDAAEIMQENLDGLTVKELNRKMRGGANRFVDTAPLGLQMVERALSKGE